MFIVYRNRNNIRWIKNIKRITSHTVHSYRIIRCYQFIILIHVINGKTCLDFEFNKLMPCFKMFLKKFDFVLYSQMSFNTFYFVNMKIKVVILKFKLNVSLLIHVIFQRVVQN